MKLHNPDLNEAQNAVLFEASTEPPFSGALLHIDADGIFVCANCGGKLFVSDHKYDSSSGWPSFDDAVPGAVKLDTDNSHGMERTELSCSRCGGHLGHLFPDGPRETTGQRYCVNSLAMQFIPDSGESTNET